jgi:hypothetical protein
MNEPDPHTPQAEAPPLLGTWRRWYAVVLIELLAVVVAAYLLTESYR